MSYDFKTSRPAYEEAKTNIGDKQLKVFETIKKLGPCTDAQIADFLGWPINRVTPRRGELIDLKMIIADGKRRDQKTKRLVNFWRIKTQTLTLF